MTFELKRLSDVAEIVGGGTPSTKQSKFWDGEIPWLTPKDLSSFNGVYVERGSRSITSDGLRASSAKMLPPGSVLYTSRAPIGYVAIAKNSIATNQGFKSFVLKEGYVPEYAFYLLKASKAEIESHASGGTFAEISAKAIADVMLPFPPFEHQRAIANLLSSLDMKLEINRSISKSLESIAQSLFKSWFIDFDPVKAKLAGEKCEGLDEETASLFPDSMEESELGLAPTGWTFSPLRSHISVTKGKSYKSSELSDSDTALVTLKSFMRGGGYRFDGLKAFSGPYKPEQVIEPGELVVSFTDVTQAADVIGKPAIVLENPKYSKLVASLDVGIVRATSKRLGQFFLYQLFLTSQFKSHVEGYTNGTTVLHLGKGALEDFVFPLPSENLLEKFEGIAKPLWGKVQGLYLENLLLEELRDSLLPRLISGELRIPEEMLAS